MKIKVELYGSSRDLSKNNFIELDLKDNCLVKDLRNKLYKFVKNNHPGNKNFHEIIEERKKNTEIINIKQNGFLTFPWLYQPTS